MNQIERAAKLTEWIEQLPQRSIPLGDDKWETVVLVALDLPQRDLLLELLAVVPVAADTRCSSELVGIRVRNVIAAQ